MDSPKPNPAPSRRPAHPAGGKRAAISAQLLEKARADSASLLQELVLGVVLRFFQELRADHAAEKLKAQLVKTKFYRRFGD